MTGRRYAHNTKYTFPLALRNFWGGGYLKVFSCGSDHTMGSAHIAKYEAGFFAATTQTHAPDLPISKISGVQNWMIDPMTNCTNGADIASAHVVSFELW